MMLKVMLALAVSVLAVTFSNAYAAFGPDGNYYCNAANLPLEETIYKSSVQRIDSGMQNYLSLNPSASDRELHSYLISNPEISQPYSIMEQSKACLQSNGVNPNNIAVPSSLVLEVFAAPEFGLVSSLILGVTLASALLLQNKINRTGLVRDS